MMTTKIKVRARGPLMVEGDFEIIDKKGELLDVQGRQKVALCRCAESKNQPFCDGTHNRTDFEKDQ